MQRPASGAALLKKGGPLVAGELRFEAGRTFDQGFIKQNADIGIANVISQGLDMARHSGGLAHGNGWSCFGRRVRGGRASARQGDQCLANVKRCAMSPVLYTVDGGLRSPGLSCNPLLGPA